MPDFTQTITNGNNDSYQVTGSAAVLTENPVPLTAGTRWALFRFTNVTIPQGSTVSSATMTVNVFSTAFDDPNLEIYCDYVDNSAAPTTNVNDISGRTLTTGYSTQWVATGVGSGEKTTPNFATAVERVLSRAGWASGNALSVIFDGLTQTDFQFYAAEQGAGFQPSISITYTPPGPAMPVVTRQFRARVQ